MALTAINTAATVKYVPKQDPNRGPNGEPVEGSTVFELGSIDGYVDAHISSKATSYTTKSEFADNLDKLSPEDMENAVDISIDIYTMAIETCRFAIKGWDNFLNDKGEVVGFKTKATMVKGKRYDAVDPDLMALLSKDVIMDLYAKIQTLNSMSKEEEKNSEKG